MGVSSISLVPRQSIVKNKEAKIKEIVDWLIEIDAIKPEKSACVLGIDELGYAISEGAKSITEHSDSLPFNFGTNGLEIETKRSIYTCMEGGLDLMICPSCNSDIVHEEWTFFDVWYSGESDNIICPLCQISKPIHDYTFNPTWGFSDLGFVFWNWMEFTESFLRKFEKRLGCNVDMVYAHL
ncbi:MAG: hypothetical protein AB8F95_16520 [Bacteroidia bacterium]